MAVLNSEIGSLGFVIHRNDKNVHHSVFIVIYCTNYKLSYGKWKL